MVSFLLSALVASAPLDNPVELRARALAQEALARGTDARAAASLIRLHALRDEVEDLGVLAAVYGELSTRRNGDGQVQDLARLLLADIERAKGRTVKSKELLRDLGFLKDFWLVGSFDNEGKSGCDVDFGAESATTLTATYPTKSSEQGWRKQELAAGDGFVDLSQALRPASDAVAYALTILEADIETKAVVSLGTSGAFRLFVNGVQVGASNVYNRPRPDQHRIQVALRRGKNRLLLKVCQVSGPYGFYLRAVPSPGSRAQLSAPQVTQVPVLERGPAPQPVSLPTLADVLERRVKTAPHDAPLRADFATVLDFYRAWPELERTPSVEAARAALAKPDDAALQLNAALLETDDFNARRRFLEAARQAAPKEPWGLLALARHELERQHPAAALALVEPLTAEFPRFGPALLLRIRALEALGDSVAALKATDAAFALLPHVPTVVREAVSASRRTDRLHEAMARARTALGLRFDDIDMRRALAAMLADAGRFDEAVEEYKKALALDPFDLGSVLRMAELLAANGRWEEASQAFLKARALSPSAPEVYEREGRARLFAKQRDEALAAFDQSLRLKPQNPALKEMVRNLRGSVGASSSELADVTEVANRLPEKTRGEDAVILADVTHVRVQPSGVASRTSQLAVKIQTDRGVDSFRQLPLTWAPDRQELQVLRARITKPDGSVLDSFSEQERQLNEPWAGMYYDTRAKVLTFPALAPQDILEVQWRLDDTTVEPLLSDYWGDVDAIAGTYPKLRYRYVVEMPSNRPLYWNRSSLPTWLSASQKRSGERTVYAFEASEVPQLVKEPNMPGWADYASPLHLSTYQSWDDVGRYYWGLVKDQLVANQEIKQTVDGLLAKVDRSDIEAVVAAIYGFVVTNTRYVALEFGIHGYKPYRVDKVLSRRFGDCKDKASLMYSMLQVAGVDARLVLLRMRHLGTLTDEVASLSAFNHAIVYVPRLERFLDGTAEFHGSRELPSADRLANVLIVEPGGHSRFFTTDEARPENNITTLMMDVTLKPSGGVEAKGSLSTVGQGAPEMRRAYESPATREATFEQQWAQGFPGIQVTRLIVSEVKALEAPVSIQFEAKLPRYAEAGGGLLRFYPFGTSRTFTQALAPLSERSADALFPGVWASRLIFTYTLPPGWEVPELPADVVEDSPFGSLRMVARKHEGKLVVDGILVMSAARVRPSEYPAFRRWLLAVDQAFARKLVVQQGPQTATRSGAREWEAGFGDWRLGP